MTTEILQRKYLDNQVYNVVSKLNNTIVNINIDLIIKDIEKFEEQLPRIKNKLNRENVKAIIKYLRDLVKTLNDDLTLELSWTIDKKTGFPKSYPMSLICEDAYNINTCSYIELDKENKFVDINLRRLADAIAFEMMCKDLGETHESIEESLKDCGVTTIESIDVLEEYYSKVSCGKSIYDLSKELKIGESAYYIRGESVIQDYFGTKRFNTKKYREAVKYSCEYANCIILGNIFKEANRTKSNLRLLSIDATRIQFEIKECEDRYIRDTLVGDIIVRILGRKFKLSNHITIY